MRLIQISALTLLLAIGVYVLPSTQALSCIKTYPLLGTVEDIRIQDNGDYILDLKWVYTFDSAATVHFDIDSYQALIEAYQANDLDAFEKVDEDADWDAFTIKIPADMANGIVLEKEDAVIKAPPLEVCDYRFTGIFNEDGVAKYAFISDSFNNYSFKGENIKVGASEPMECSGYSCKTKALFSLREKDYELVPTQSVQPANKIVQEIKLFSAVHHQEGIDPQKFFPFGGSAQVSYRLTFNKEGIATYEQGIYSTSTEVSTTTNEPSAEAASSSEESEVLSPSQPEQNVFQRFFAWILSFFKK
ncbi:MAG: hypothetical protein R3B52_00315 [Candidatus Paceibacterota bacterium]